VAAAAGGGPGPAGRRMARLLPDRGVAAACRAPVLVLAALVFSLGLVLAQPYVTRPVSCRAGARRSRRGEDRRGSSGRGRRGAGAAR